MLILPLQYHQRTSRFHFYPQYRLFFQTVLTRECYEFHFLKSILISISPKLTTDILSFFILFTSISLFLFSSMIFANFAPSSSFVSRRRASISFSFLFIPP